MSLGGQTVGFVTVSRGAPGYLGLGAESRSTTNVSGCRFRPFVTTETPEGETDVATEMWKCTAPKAAFDLDIQPGDEMTYDGKTFHVVGMPAPKFNMDGSLHHVTIMAKRQR